MDSYNVYQLLWIFFVYSFIGWCGEAAMAAVHRHKFVNRGFVSGPICPVYGAGAAAVAVFLPELKDQLFFLFLGAWLLFYSSFCLKVTVTTVIFGTVCPAPISCETATVFE